MNLRNSYPWLDDYILLGTHVYSKSGIVNNGDGKVTPELKMLPYWTNQTTLSELDKFYARILPEAKIYISDFVEKLYASRINSG